MRTAYRIMRLGIVASFLAAGPLYLPTAAAESTFDVSVLAGSCANCHGVDGHSLTSIPTIAGRPESILLEQLKAFKSDTPPTNTTIMDRLAKGFSDDELAALARHFSQVNAQPTTQGL